jgi:diadenosine tetraphosphatase ApaH/serine/threonine PP2A family protein phosphatase
MTIWLGADGSPLDEDEYLVGLDDVRFLGDYLETQLTFFGHTHLQGGFLLTKRSVKRFIPDRTLQIEPDYFYLINPGSVGQPRDGDPRAAYALYSPEDRTVEYGRVPYDIGRAAAKILQAEFPSPGDAVVRRNLAWRGTPRPCVKPSVFAFNLPASINVIRAHLAAILGLWRLSV